MWEIFSMPKSETLTTNYTLIIIPMHYRTKSIQNYQILQPIGKGSNGSVYKGHDIHNGTLVAIKQFYLGTSQVKRIKAEINALKRITHENIVKYFDVIEKERKIYLILQYLQAGSLGDLAKKSPFSQKLCKLYIRQVLTGVSYLHQQQILHRDIKGANILLAKDGKTKLADFGLAVNMKDNQRTFTTAGTVYWMSPQAITSEKQLTTKSDIWSIGCTVIEFLTGKPPYSQYMEIPALLKIVEDQIPPLPQCSQQCRQFLLACFKRNQAERPSADELLQYPWLAENLSISKNSQQICIRTQEQIMEVFQTQNYIQIEQFIAHTINKQKIYKQGASMALVDKMEPKLRLNVLSTLIRNDIEALRYISQLRVFKKSLKHQSKQKPDLIVEQFLLLEQILTLQKSSGNLSIFMGNCLDLVLNFINKKNKLKKINSQSLQILQKSINILQQLYESGCISQEHLDYLLLEEQVFQACIQLYFLAEKHQAVELKASVLELFLGLRLPNFWINFIKQAQYSETFFQSLCRMELNDRTLYLHLRLVLKIWGIKVCRDKILQQKFIQKIVYCLRTVSLLKKVQKDYLYVIYQLLKFIQIYSSQCKINMTGFIKIEGKKYLEQMPKIFMTNKKINEAFIATLNVLNQASI